MQREEIQKLGLEVIERCNKLLAENTGWETTYGRYIDAILKGTSAISTQLKTFHEYKPLFLYLNIGKAMSVDVQKGNIQYSLRYCGQEVARLEYTAKSEKLVIHPSKNNSAYLAGYDDEAFSGLKKMDWKSNAATDFRRFFLSYPHFSTQKYTKERSREHRVESALLTEFSKASGVNKSVTHIQPVLLSDCRYQLTTPFSASKLKDYVKNPVAHSLEDKITMPRNRKTGELTSGGGIDILCRTHRGKNSTLAVLELKDENNTKEPLEAALMQALAYAVFVRALLRSEKANGQAWWNLFGWSGTLPEKLNINVAAVMPLDGPGTGESFEGQALSADGTNGNVGQTDTFHLHDLFFEFKKGEHSPDVARVLKTSLPDIRDNVK